MLSNGESIYRSQEATWWLPVSLQVKSLSGETVEKVDPNWSFWFEHVNRYEWHFDGAPLLKSQLATASLTPLATTRYDAPIGAEVTINAINPMGPTRLPASIFWLPKSTSLHHSEAVDLLLRELGVRPRETKPPWLDAHRLPEELHAAAALDVARSDFAHAAESVRQAEQTLQHAERFGRLLYEQGRDALEPVVCEALSTLGAAVIDPPREGVDDGRLTDPQGRAMMLEVKGRRGQLKLEDVRQLDGWMRSAMAEEGWDGRGLLIANLKLNEEPGRRKRKDLVASNALAFAERIGIAILLTPDVWTAVEAFQKGEFNSNLFWDSVATTSGLVEL